MKRIAGWIAVLLLAGLASCADQPSGPKANQLGSGTFTVNTHASVGDPVFTFFRVGTTVGNSVALFDTILFDTTRVGREFAANAATDTDFVKVAARLADGTASLLCTGDCDLFTCATTCSDEKSFFGLGTTDFSPATVEEIDLHLDSTAIVSGGAGGPFRRYFFTVTVLGNR